MALKLEFVEVLAVTRTANTTLSANRLVKADADPKNMIVCTANARAEGVVLTSAVTGDPVKVVKAGLVPVVAGAVLGTPGTAVVSDATGRVVAAGATGDQNIVGFTVSTSGAAGDLITIFLWPTAKYASPTDGGIAAATIVVGAESAHPGHAINVAVQLKDVFGNDLSVVGVVHAFFSSDAAGKDAVTTTLTTDLAIGTDGSCVILLAKSAYLLVSEADGDIDFNLVKDDGAATVYLNLVLPSGKIVTSDAITFSA